MLEQDFRALEADFQKAKIKADVQGALRPLWDFPFKSYEDFKKFIYIGNQYYDSKLSLYR